MQEVLMYQRVVTISFTVLLTCLLYLFDSNTYAATTIDDSLEGAPYRITVPEEWNGELVILLHGYVFPGSPLTLPPQGHEIFTPLSENLATQGYAVAYSAYRINGYAVREGLQDSQRLVGEVTDRLGRPAEVWLLSYSMGTHIGMKLLEQGPRHYSGLLAVCAAVGGATIQNDYFHDARVLFDYFYPGVLPGDVLTADLEYFSEVLPAAVSAIVANPFPAIELASVMGIQWLSPQELVEGVVSSLVLAGGGTNDLQSMALGLSYDNREDIYSGSFDDVALNELVGRYDGDPQALRYMQRYHDPSGELRSTPLLHLHTARDPIVPLERHVSAYQTLLDHTGQSDYYAVKIYDRFGHCLLSPQEVLSGFEDLVEWQHTGLSPSP
jgi:pimeloyl-ACP methyl ester carboxylesterase